jgi:putative ABC transport system permease protein
MSSWRASGGAAARHLYAVLLYLYPSPFLRAYGRDMRDTFDARLARLGNGRLHRCLVFCLTNYIDVIGSACVEWLHRPWHRRARSTSALSSTTLHPASVGLLAVTLGVCGAVLPWTYHSFASPLPFRDPSRLVRLGERSPVLRTDYVSPLTFDDWRSHSDAFQDVAAFRHWQYVPLEDGHGGLETVTHVASTANFFAVLGVQPMLGRTFRDEQRPLGSETVVSHAFWREHLGGDANVIGHVIRLRGIETTIVGVLPPMSPGLDLGWGDVWTCLYRYDVAQQRATRYRGRYLTVVGRLAAGVTVDDARRRLDGLQRRLWVDPSSVAAGFHATVDPVRALSDTQHAVVLAISGAAGVALLSVLGFAFLRAASTARRTSARQRVRRWRLAVACVGLGLTALFVTSRGMSQFLDDLPRGSEGTWSRWVIIGVALLCAVSSWIPACRRCPHEAVYGPRLRNLDRGSKRWASHGLAALQFALAVLLVACTGLVWRSVTELDRVHPGFDTQGAWSFDVFLPASSYQSDADYTHFVGNVVRDLGAHRGASSAGALLYFPQRAKVWPTPVWAQATHGGLGAERGAYFNLIAGDALSAMGTRLELGRVPTVAETFDGTPVAVINHALASALFPTGDVLGQRVRTDPVGPWFEVIGVVEDMRQQRLDLPGEPEVFLPFWTMPMPFMTFVVRSGSGAADVISQIRRAVAQHDAHLTVAELAPLTRSVGTNATDQRFVLGFLAILAAIVVTTLAVTAYEIGRASVARGLTRAAAVRRAAWGVVAVAVPGMALGTTAMAPATSWAGALLFGVGPTDALVYGVASAIAGSIVLAISAGAGLSSLRPSLRTIG